MILYYSGTGNSRYCAKMLARLLNDEAVDAFPYLREGTAPRLYSDKPWVFVCPTYSWQIPHVFRDLLLSAELSGNSDAYFVMSCGSDIGNAGESNIVLCAKLGMSYHGSAEIIMPENYIAMFEAPETAEALEIIRRAEPSIKAAADTILKLGDIPCRKISFTDRLKSGIVNVGFNRFQISAKPFKVSDACISCGKCEAGCPLGNISLMDGKPVWGKRCTHCMSCICACPTEAIEYGRISAGKARYVCPEYARVE